MTVLLGLAPAAPATVLLQPGARGVFGLDSKTAADNWPYYAVAAAGVDRDIGLVADWNQGVNGDKWVNFTTRREAAPEPFWGADFAVIYGGTNGARDASAVLTAAAAEIAVWTGAGKPVFLCQLPPFAYGGSWDYLVPPDQVAIINDGYADLAATDPLVALIPPPPDWDVNTMYPDTDGIHENELGKMAFGRNVGAYLRQHSAPALPDLAGNVLPGFSLAGTGGTITGEHVGEAPDGVSAAFAFGSTYGVTATHAVSGAGADRRWTITAPARPNGNALNYALNYPAVMHAGGAVEMLFPFTSTAPFERLDVFIRVDGQIVDTFYMRGVDQVFAPGAYAWRSEPMDLPAGELSVTMNLIIEGGHAHTLTFSPGALRPPVAEVALAIVSLVSNPLAALPGAPAETAWTPPTEAIVQVGIEGQRPHHPAGCWLNEARRIAGWDIYENGSQTNKVTFTHPDTGAYLAEFKSQRDLVPNAHHLPDLGAGRLAPGFADGSAKLGTILYASNTDPDWNRWRRGEYEVVVEYEAGAELNLLLGSYTGPRGVKTTETLPDGFVRDTYALDVSGDMNALFMSNISGTAREWRRLSIYQTARYADATTTTLTPTDDRERDERGEVWVPRWLDLWCRDYNCVRMLDLFEDNLCAEWGPHQRSRVSDQTNWARGVTYAPFNALPWDATLHHFGDWRAGVPIKAQIDLCVEASLRARETGSPGHVVNPWLFVPHLYVGEDRAAWLDELADCIADAAARGVVFDYVMLDIFNEPWNGAAAAFRQSANMSAMMPKVAYDLRNTEMANYDADRAARFASVEMWYLPEADYAEPTDGLHHQSVRTRAPARALMEWVLRAKARHPDINWTGSLAMQTVTGGFYTDELVRGARDAAADAERWSVEGDPYSGSKEYAVLPKLPSGEHDLGGLVAHSVTGYWKSLYSANGAPKTLGGLTDAEIKQKATDGTLNTYLRDLFLTLPAEPADPATLDYGFDATVAGMRAKIDSITAAAASLGGLHVTVYEADSHLEERELGTTDPDVLQAFGAWFVSPEHAEVMDAINAAYIAAGTVGVSNFALVGKNENADGFVTIPPWLDLTDPYSYVGSAQQQLWRKRIAPLV